MIFVTVGTHTKSFERLVAAMDRYAAGTTEEVVIQSGSSTYQPQAAHWFDYAGADEVQRLTAAARVVVSHAGAGSILMAPRGGKPLVVMPRRSQAIPEGTWANLRQPAMIVGGTRSDTWMRNAQKAIARALPNARHGELEGENHMVKPTAIAPLIKDFFAA